MGRTQGGLWSAVEVLFPIAGSQVSGNPFHIGFEQVDGVADFIRGALAVEFFQSQGMGMGMGLLRAQIA